MSVKRSADEMENEASVSLQDYVAEDEEMQDTADAVLGASDDQECTYTKGYVKRQALYACYTCCTSEDPPAGVCLACSLECHNGHDLYELYTKRNFRCDCGNEKFSMKCKLESEKDPDNGENVYSQNFRGLYCTCHRPYPDEEDDVEDEMIQCVVCEDWFHSRHLGETSVPSNMDFAEMICLECTKRCNFLLKYSALMVAPTKVEKDLENFDVNVVDVPNASCSSELKIEHKSLVNDDIKVDNEKDELDKSAGVSCSINGAIPIKINGATFWPAQWRAVLCQCQDCHKIYDDLKVKFLLDESDTVSAYEDEGKKRAREKKIAQEQTAFAGMSRFLQVEMLSGYQDIKEGFYEHFRKFAEEGKVVTEADVRKFFTLLKNKRQKLDMSYNCR